MSLQHFCEYSRLPEARRADRQQFDAFTAGKMERRLVADLFIAPCDYEQKISAARAPRQASAVAAI
jgi:hypothetical protein